MSFTKTDPSDFEFVKTWFDDELTIIRHKPTGFCNISKLRDEVETMKKIASDHDNKPLKKTQDWISDELTIEIIDAVKFHLGIEYASYELDDGTYSAFKGHYVHEFLVDRFMIWLHPSYAIKLSLFLNKIRMNANRTTHDHN